MFSEGDCAWEIVTLGLDADDQRGLAVLSIREDGLCPCVALVGG